MLYISDLYYEKNVFKVFVCINDIKLSRQFLHCLQAYFLVVFFILIFTQGHGEVIVGN